MTKLENAVFEAYRLIEPETIAVLTRSVKFRVQLYVARGGCLSGMLLKNVVGEQRPSWNHFVRLTSTQLFQRLNEDKKTDMVMRRGLTSGDSLPSFHICEVVSC